MSKITCGIFLIDKNDLLLIGKPTGGNVWSIPKGLLDEGETFEQAAIREFKEEANINLLESDLNPLEAVKYKNKQKILVPFYIKLDLEYTQYPEPVCYSMVSAKNGKPAFPEICEFKWCSIGEALQLIHETQQQALMEYICQ